MKNLYTGHYIIEVGWEVCQRLGGIYTVLRSKAPEMERLWGDKYCLLGPYNEDTARIEFEETEISPLLQKACEKLKEKGITAYTGRWRISGRPQVILLSYEPQRAQLDTYKYYMWTDHNIKVGNSVEVNNAVLFGYTAVDFFQSLLEAESEIKRNYSIVGHFHEWMAGVPIPIIRYRQLQMAIIFTTHATILGRYIAGSNHDFYSILPYIDPYYEANNMGITPKFTIERAATHGAYCFSTVSEITGEEAEYLLGRKPDVLLPNGLNIQRFTAIHEFQNYHAKYKEEIHKFIMGHFFNNYAFELEDTIYLFTSGRYEFKNKGLDLFIDSLVSLNEILKQKKSNKTVVAFIITKAEIKNININVLTEHSMFNELQETCEEISKETESILLRYAARGEIPDVEDMITEHSRMKLERLYLAWQRKELPPIVTHELMNPETDKILQKIQESGLQNQEKNPVKIVYHPDFLRPTSPILGMEYDQFVRGCHMGVFPSYYEPWGYTPLECVALGLPSITTDLSGFGAYVYKNIPEHDEYGIHIVERKEKSYNESVEQLVSYMYEFVSTTRRERVEQRNRVESTSEKFSWSNLIEQYKKAYRIASQRIGK